MTTTATNNYNPHDHLVQIRAKDGTMKDYYPAAWRLYELRLKHPTITIESEILHMNEENNFVVIKASIFDGKTYEESSMRATSMKQGQLSSLDKVETAAKARASRDFGIGTELALDSEPEEDLDTPSSTGPQGTRKAATRRTVETGNTAPAISKEAAMRLVNPLKVKARNAGFIAGATDGELIKAWNEAKRSVYLREVSDEELIKDEALRVQMRDAIDRYVAANQPEQKKAG